MKLRIWSVTTPIALIACLQLLSAGAQDLRVDRLGSDTAPHAAPANGGKDDPIALGHPLSYWLKGIATRDPETAEMAFDAIVVLGPAARKAIPELMKIVEQPFTPIQLDTDSRTAIHAKLLDIHLRAGAVDGLGAIGDAAAPSAEVIIRWGLTVRVLPPEGRLPATGLLIELIGMDVLERMRAAGSVARLGMDAFEPVQALIQSADNEKRKFAAAILSDTTVPIATDLMQSKDCSDRALGVALLSAMWPVVAKEHLTTLKDALECSNAGERNVRTPIRPTGRLLIELSPPDRQ